MVTMPTYSFPRERTRFDDSHTRTQDQDDSFVVRAGVRVVIIDVNPELGHGRGLETT
jgi:hypothetical protein